MSDLMSERDYWAKKCEMLEAALKKECALVDTQRQAESALISMVQQYCYRPLDINKEPAINVYQHDFMSAGEEAFRYLVEHGLAQWTDERKHSITMP